MVVPNLISKTKSNKLNAVFLKKEVLNINLKQAAPFRNSLF
jgi:hypothetical protein